MVKLHFVVTAVPIVPTSAMIMVYCMVAVMVVVFMFMLMLMLLVLVIMLMEVVVMVNVAVRQPWLLRRRTGLLHTESQGGRDWRWTRWKHQR